jgi:hypothetical protein
MRRYLRLVCAGCARDSKLTNESESMQAPGFVSFLVLTSLDRALLDAPDLLDRMLDVRGLRHDVLKALERIGRPAIAFARKLLSGLDAIDEQSRHFDAPHALAAVGAGDPEIVEALLARLNHQSVHVRRAACDTLTHMGPDVAALSVQLTRRLMEMTYDPDDTCAATRALASVAREDESALHRVLELAAPQPPRMVSVPNHPQYAYDAVSSERGSAIDGLAFFSGFADRVIPVLIEAFDSFEEYDPDLSYEGDHERVCAALEKFGAAAAPAVPRLIRALETWAGIVEAGREDVPGWPNDIFKLLTSIGPAAQSALPVLRRIREIAGPAPEPLDPDNKLDRAILAIECRR